MITFERIVVVAGAVVAFLLQVLVAPHIAIGYGVPNIVAVFCIVVSLVQPNIFKYVLPFVMGLVYDLLSGGPIGAMAFSLTASSAVVIWFFQRSNNDTLFMGMAAMLIGVFLVEFLHGIFILASGFSANLIDAFVYRMLPCFLYDAVLGAILYPIALRFLSSQAPLRSEITQLH